jgi:uncharacterized repeat protein (TIGR02543 family)
MSLYVDWTPNTYYVAFDPNGGNGSMSNQSFTYGTAQNLAINTYTRTGYTFGGWDTLQGGGGTAYADVATVNNLTFTQNDTVTLYAVWAINTYTVSFNSNGGTTVGSITNVAHGNTISAPTAPTTTAGGATLNLFRGWYTDNTTFTNAFNFSTTITTNITLYADWGYRPGDTGPGGGKIFYRLEAGFTHYANAGDSTGTTAYYLEAAPADTSIKPTWVSGTYNTALINVTGTAIGTGRQNTDLIVIACTGDTAANNAAKACYDCTDNGETDWFLPSKDELNALYENRSYVGMVTTPTNRIYWSSSEDPGPSPNTRSYCHAFDDGTNGFNTKTGSYRVRAIRAF